MFLTPVCCVRASILSFQVHGQPTGGSALEDSREVRLDGVGCRHAGEFLCCCSRGGLETEPEQAVKAASHNSRALKRVSVSDASEPC